MAICRNVVKHYEGMGDQQLNDLWNTFNKKGPSVEILRDILMYYIHHKNFPPVMQKSCDTLLASVDFKNAPKKVKILIFQIMEEVGACLESSIVEQVSLTSQNNVHKALFNCILVGGLVPLLDETTVEKLLSLLKCPQVSMEERGKLLLCLLAVHQTCPPLISLENLSRVEILMTNWFRCSPGKSMASPVSLFSRTDSLVATEVDSNYAGDLFTVLTLANTFTDQHMMGIHCFSSIREWLGMRIIHQNRKLIDSIREYCSVVAEQCFRSAHKEHDIALQKAILCEVLDIMNLLVQLDTSNGPLCLIIVKRIQNNVKENFTGDHRDVSIFVGVLSFLLNFGETTGYNSQLICEHFLQEMVYRSYASGLAALDIMLFLLENKHKIKALQHPLLQRFFPNIFKIIASHPCTVLEEFLDLLPDFVSDITAVEVFHSIVDLPLLSATLCLHQAPLVIQSENVGSMDTEWAELLKQARSTEYRHIFNYLMRTESGQEIALEKMPVYIMLLNKINNQNLVMTCSQIVPLILEAYFHVIGKWKDVCYVTPVVLSMFKRLSVLFDVPGYTSSFKRCLLKHLKQLFKKYSELVFTSSNYLIEYISTVKNCEIYPQLYIHVVYIIGEHSHLCNGNIQQMMNISEYFDVIECLIYGILAQIAISEDISWELLNVASSTLAKLASKLQDQIPRALICLNKIRAQISVGNYLNHEEVVIVRDRIEELLCVLHHPNIANTMWVTRSSSTSLTSFVQVLSRVTDT